MRGGPLAMLLALLLTLTASAAETPRLIVVISVDQLRFDYVDRFAPFLTERGFKRFAREGAVFPNARYRYSVTFTGPGHASIGTGLLPAESGIVGNSWFERDAPFDETQWRWYFDDITAYTAPALATRNDGGEAWWKQGGTPRYCTYDERVQVTAGKTSGMSPANVSGDALGDRIKERFPQSRVIALALKDRASILMGGRRADAAYWFDRDLPGFVSSTYYRFNPEVLAFNAQVRGYVPASAEWRPSSYIPPADLQRITFDPPAAWPLKNTTYGGTFPHPIKSIRALTYAPFAQDLVLDFAQHVIATENLGSRDASPDVLFVGVTPFDYVGHYYGPDSMEAADTFARLDRSLAQFLDALERRFGDRVLVAITADHGVQPNPEIAKLRDPKVDAGRLDLRTPDPRATRIADLPPMRIEIERKLAVRLGILFSEDAPLTNAFVYFFEEPGLWLNWRHVAALGLDGERVKRALRDVLKEMTQHGIADVWTNTELLAPDPNASRLKQLMHASWRSDRSGDVLIALRPGWIWMWGSNSTTHGQPVENDMHVPLMFWGTGVKRGVYDVDASPLDLARTLGAFVGVDAGGRASRELPCF